MADHKQKLEEKFKEVYKSLNEQQRDAVDTLEGPVMVIAGPGTGKTQILAARIARILLEPDHFPENILCLTYTDAGVVAMRKRLQQFIGADAYKVNIYTFHAFCNDVIQDNLSLFEKTSLDPISDLERIALLKQLIDAFPKNHPLKRYRGEVYHEIPNLTHLFSTMKREGWKPSFINERIADYLNRIRDSDEYKYKVNRGHNKKGDYKPAYYEQIQRMEKLRAAVNEFENYQQLMRQNNRYDFDDMINWVINAFEENPNLLATYQERFQYILVDEFQDTSGTQNKIVQLLISYWDKPNVFVVGDDDQSIYRFQGANVQNMLDFAQQYSNDLKTVILTNNYRSIQPILDVSKTLISRNNERLVRQLEGLSKDLLAANSAINQLDHPPVIIEYKTATEEMVGITLKVEELIDEGVAPGRIAVIYRENKYGEELAHYFRIKQIPVYSKRNINLLEQPFIKKIVTILRYLNAEHDMPYSGDEMLFEMLHYDFYENPPIEIAKLNVELNHKKYNGQLTSLRQLLHEKANTPPKDLFDTGLPQSMKDFSMVYEQLIADVANMTLQQLMDHIIRNAGVLAYIMKCDKKILMMQFLTAFFDFIKEENRRKPTLSLQGLISLIDLMESEKVPLPMVRISGTDNGVNLLTAHGSKGLEFEYVFLAGTNCNVWEKKSKKNIGYKLPDTMFTSLAEGNDTEELRRLFYVAITRAEKFLFISYASFDSANKALEPSMFIAEILEHHPFNIQQKDISQEQLFDFHHLILGSQLPVMPNAEDDFIDGLLSRFVMNVTALNNYLDCPLKFYYQNLLRIPSGKNEATEFGSAVHFALERLFKRMKEASAFPPVQTMVDDFSWHMQRHRENFTKESFARRLEHGAIIIPAYYNKYVNEWNKIVAIELNIRAVVDYIPVKGKIDKLEFEKKDVNVVDYKTGSFDSAKNKLLAPNEKQPNGGDYWRQAVFYKLLLDNYEHKKWHAVSAEFDFIEPDSKNNFQKRKIFIDPADLTTVKQQLTAVWHKIQNKDFYTGCGKPDCHWCNFVKDNVLYERLEEPEEEE